jgi:hypothetical protein
MTFLYRFRPLSRLLDKNELLNQEIFFASPDSLNDPMEGFRDIFWQGDVIVWQNLFRHYLLCLEWAYSIVVLGEESEPLSWKNIPFSNVHDVSFTQQYATRIEQLVASFRAERGVSVLVEALAKRAAPIRRDELAAYLQPIHTLALSVIKKNYRDHGLNRQQEDDPVVDEYLAHSADQLALMLQHIERLVEDVPDAEHAISALFKAHDHAFEQFRLLDRYNKSQQAVEANRNFVLFDFPSDYIKRLETLVYPDWYVACFMKECRSSSVWGSYGDSHTAACLIFRVKDEGDAPSLRLRRTCGHNSNGAVVDYVAHSFHEVVYENAHLPVDFFRSLGRLPTPYLSKAWYADDTGQRSICADDVFTDEEAWRDRYWAAFYHGITRKLQAWRYEKEQRLILSGMTLDFSGPDSRATNYDFNDLEGIIFGINTPIDKKIAICRIIEEKCRAVGRRDFKFFQAYYAQEKGTIEHAELSLLKFDIP